MFCPTGFFKYGYTRYKIQELELQNDLLVMQLGISQQKIHTLTKNVSKTVETSEAKDNKITNSLSKCETIHIAMVCASYKSSTSAVNVFKSILFYRNHPLHFHIMVDEVAANILGELFSTWKLPFGK